MKGKKIPVSLSLGLAAFALTPALAAAQRIGVTVNGDPVMFSNVGPISQSGRVLVPLRGVMEKLGAYVGWEPSTQMVTANKGDIDLQLRIGQRTATVNGRMVTLDVPAQIYRGSTMVPLRFVSEALGAEVRWDAPTYTVFINTTGAVNQPPIISPPSRDIEINSFDFDHSGYVRGGDRITFRMIGTSGAVASVQIPGVAGDIPMREERPGEYVATWTAPAGVNALTLSNASVIGKLRVGNSERLIQAANRLRVDTEPPEIRNMTPEPNGRIARSRPHISAVLDDAGGSGIETTSVRMLLDGQDVTRNANISGSFVSYTADRALAAGRHDVEITARDLAGNPVTRSWSFRVVGDSAAVTSFSHNGGSRWMPGDVIIFTLVAEPGGTATFSVGDRTRDIRMREVSPGRYEGEYTVRRRDTLAGERATARFTNRDGETFTIESSNQLGSVDGLLEAPAITSPRSGDRPRSPMVIRGTAAPYSRVRVSVDYSTSLLGLLRTNGSLAELVVDADANGNWQTREINLDSIGGSDTEYTVTAVTVGANDQRSNPTTLRLRG